MAELLLLVLFSVLAVLLGKLGYRAWAFLKKPRQPPVDDPSRAEGWAFERHPRDAMRSVWWMGAGVGLFASAAILAVLVALSGGGPLGAFIGIIVGPIFGGLMFICGFIMLPVTAIRFRMYRWLMLWLAIMIIANGVVAGVSDLISGKIWPFR